MTICNNCGGEFDWGKDGEKWVLLEPIATHSDLDRRYVDEDGVLRADHRDRHTGGQAALNVARLDRRVRAEDVEKEEPLHKRVAAASRVVRGKG